jgi:hypothetical protein
MNNILQDIFHLFSSKIIDVSIIEENFTKVEISTKCDDLRIPSQRDFNIVCAKINSRDSVNISIIQNDSPWNYVQDNKDCDYNQFVQDCSTIQQSDEKEIIISLTKKNKEQTISIYYLENFLYYLNSLPISGFLLKINEAISTKEHITFEIQDESFIEFSTKTIKFIPKGNQNQNWTIRNTNNLDKIKNLCYCNIISKYQFTPDDFYPIKKNGTVLDIIFGRVSVLYSAIFLFDIFDINSTNIEYRLNGYKTITHTLNFLEVDIFSYENFYDIYSWVYEGGNIVDKIGLARNILSLNLKNENLKLSETTFEAIKSGYKIYQKENIKQYIEIRNKVSDQLIELQNKADKIVENFVGDYKKSFLAIVSFFISVIVIRVVSKGDFAGGFTIEVTFLLISFLLIFLIIMFFARWEINKQIDRYVNFYANLKERCNDLLDESDVNRILNNDKDFENNKQFIENRRKNYTILWVISLLILFVPSIILFTINNLNFCQLIKGVLFCIKNILQ